MVPALRSVPETEVTVLLLYQGKIQLPCLGLLQRKFVLGNWEEDKINERCSFLKISSQVPKIGTPQTTPCLQKPSPLYSCGIKSEVEEHKKGW